MTFKVIFLIAMTPFNINSIFYYLRDHIQEIPSHILGIIAEILFFGLITFFVIMLGSVSSFFALLFFQSEIVLVSTFFICVAIFSLDGLIKGIGIITNGYAQSREVN